MTQLHLNLNFHLIVKNLITKWKINIKFKWDFSITQMFHYNKWKFNIKSKLEFERCTNINEKFKFYNLIESWKLPELVKIYPFGGHKRTEWLSECNLIFSYQTKPVEEIALSYKKYKKKTPKRLQFTFQHCMISFKDKPLYLILF